MSDETRPESVPAPLIAEALRAMFTAARADAATGLAPRAPGRPLAWVITVPDTHQKSLLALLEHDPDLKVLTVATEDEAHAIAAGFHMAGEPCMLLIQHAGVFASINTMRGVAIDGRVPTFYLIGLLSRDPAVDPRESKGSMLRYCEPLLDLFGVPSARLEGLADVECIPEYYRLSLARRGPAAVLVGMATS